jgi:hypothetical protein
MAPLELLHADRRTWRSEQVHLLQIFITNIPEIPIKMLVAVEEAYPQPRLMWRANVSGV